MLANGRSSRRERSCVALADHDAASTENFSRSTLSSATRAYQVRLNPYLQRVDQPEARLSVGPLSPDSRVTKGPQDRMDSRSSVPVIERMLDYCVRRGAAGELSMRVKMSRELEARNATTRPVDLTQILPPTTITIQLWSGPDLYPLYTSLPVIIMQTI